MGCKQQEQGGSSGLAYLVHNPITSDAPSQTALLLDYVYQLPQPASDVVSRAGEVVYPDLNSRVVQHIASLKQQAAVAGPRSAGDAGAGASSAEAGSSSSSPSTASEQPRGRVGPRDVTIDKASECGAFGFSTDGLSLEALGNFTSCRANVAVFAGKWFYECTVLTSGIQQIGWATIHCPFTAEEGVGDAPDSYAIDGKRLRKWNVKPQPYGESWVQGDVMGCGIDLDAGTITFWRNGQCLGVAYDRVRTMQPSLAYFPAVSLSHTERCSLNFGAKPFTYPVDGYQPLQAGPSAADRVAAEYCCSCLARLALAAVERPEHGSSDGGSTVAVVTASEKEYSLVDQLEGAAVSAGPPAASVAAAAAAAAAAKARAPTGAAPAGGGLAAGWAPPFAGPPMTVSSADMLLLSSIVLGPLQELLVLQPYLVQSALLPLLTELQQMAGDGQQQVQLLLMLQLMHVVWGDSFRDIVFAVLEELAYRCQVSPLLVQDYPYTAAYPHLLLAVCLLQHKPTMRLFVKHPDFYIVMEGLLARKAPSPKDLQQLLPHVWWKGCRDETASEERLRASVSIITTTVAKVEQRQYELLELLLATPWSDDTRTSTGSSASSTASSAVGSNSCALLVFLRFLLQKNMFALRDVPPPGLSEPTVLMSAFFGLLQLLQPALQSACEHGSGPLAAFPAAELFAGVGPAAEAEPVFNMPRLGGVVTHLAREHPVSAVEKQPVAVQQGGKVDGSSYSGSAFLQDAWLPELLNSCLLLYAWRVGFNYKMVHNLSSTVITSSTALEDLDRMIAQNDGQQMSSWLHGTRKVYYDELSRDVRLLTLLCVAFFSPGKQTALCNLSRYLALLTTSISNLQPTHNEAAPAATAAAQASAQADAGSDAAAGAAAAAASAAQQVAAGRAADTDAGLTNLLRYLPVVYVEVVVDFLTALRKSADSAVGAPAIDLQAVHAFIVWSCCVLNNPRIANPDIQEGLLAVVGLLLDNPTWRELLEQQQERAIQLVGALLQVFDSRLWHPTTGVLLKVMQNSGFGHPARQPHPANSLQQVMMNLLQHSTALPAPAATSAATSPSRTNQQQQTSGGAAAPAPASPLPSPPATAAEQAAARGSVDRAVARGFVNRLFSTLNWTLTEFTVAVGELHNLRGQRSILEVQNQYRRTGLMFELSVNFLRLLEFVVPTPAFLGSAVNRTRLRELLQFVLSHFTNGPDARRLNELLQTSQPVAATSSSGGGAQAPQPPPAAAGTATAAASAAAGAAAGASGAPPPVRQGPMQPSPAAVAAVTAAAPLAGGLLSAGGAGPGAPGVPAYALQALRLESSSLSERVQKTALLAPLVGILLALWDSYLTATAAAVPSLGPAAAASAVAAAALDGEVALAGAAAGGSNGSSIGSQSALLQELAEVADERFMTSLRFLQDVDWSAAFPSQPLSVPLRAFGQLLDALAAARIELAAAVAAQALPDDMPDDFLDPITMEMMKDPVTLPDSQIVVDRSTIERHLLSSATDPFSRAALSMEQLQPATELTARMQDWMEEHRAAASAKRQQEQDQHQQPQGGSG